MNKYIKLVFAGLLMVLGIYMMFFTRNLGWGIVVFLLSALPIALFFKNTQANILTSPHKAENTIAFIILTLPKFPLGSL